MMAVIRFYDGCHLQQISPQYPIPLQQPPGFPPNPELLVAPELGYSQSPVPKRTTPGGAPSAT